MNAIVETCRGAMASALWLGGMPYLNYSIAHRAKDAIAGRAFLAAHCQRFFDRCGVRLEIDGDPPAAGTGCVISYNEPSFMDVAAFGRAMWPYVDRAAAAELYGYIPFGRRACSKLHMELVPRGNRAGTDRLLTKMVGHVQSGERVAWGGEGRIAGIDGIGHYKIGGSLLAIRAQTSVVPCAFFGGHQIMPLGSVRARPGTIHIRFGPPISAVGVVEADARAFAERIRTVMVGMYEDLRRKSLET